MCDNCTGSTWDPHYFLQAGTPFRGSVSGDLEVSSVASSLHDRRAGTVDGPEAQSFTARFSVKKIIGNEFILNCCDASLYNKLYPSCVLHS